MSDPAVHECPLNDRVTTPCCGRTPFEIPLTDRLTKDTALVTCRKQAQRVEADT